MNRKRKLEVNGKRYSYDDLLQNVTEESVDLDNEEEVDGDENLENRENRKLYVDKVDKSTSDLFRMIKEKELNCTDPQKLDQESNEWRSVFL